MRPTTLPTEPNRQLTGMNNAITPATLNTHYDWLETNYSKVKDIYTVSQNSATPSFMKYSTIF